MKTLLLFACLALTFATKAQTWVNPLPLDTISGYVTYRGRVNATSQSQEQLAARATRYAATELSNSTEYAKIEYEKEQPQTIKGNGQRVFTWRGGAVGSAGRTLHYVLSIRPHPGYYEYELNELTNETPAVQARVYPGVATTIAPNTGGIERILRNPTSYDKKHNPTPALRAYCEAVNTAARAALADVQAALTR